jgi:curved DNA-binding protein CbpA
MAPPGDDPYQTLGVSPSASDDELRTAYRRLVQVHHPDHNGGSAQAARRFEAVQEAYAQVRQLRGAAPRPGQPSRDTQAPRPSPTDANVEARMADLERELREAQAARERVRQAAREAAAGEAAAREATARQATARQATAHGAERPSDEDLGYVTTNDSFAKILADARDELADRFSELREAARRTGER